MKRLVAMLCLSALAVSAENVSWNATDGDLSVPANWTGGVLPTDADTIVFGQEASFTLTTSSWLKNAGALFNAGASGGDVTLDLAGYGLQLTNTLTFKRQSGTGPYSLALTGGTFLTEKAVKIGDGNAFHTLRVSGAGTQWICATNREGFTVSGNSNRLEIADGAYFYSGGYSLLEGTGIRGVISGAGTYVRFENPLSTQNPNDAVFALRGGLDGGELHVTDRAVLYVKSSGATDKALCVNNWYGQPRANCLILDGGAVITNIGMFAVDTGINDRGSNNGNLATISNATLYVNGQTVVGYGWNPAWSGAKVGGCSNVLSVGGGALVKLGGTPVSIGLNQRATENLFDIHGTAFVTNSSTTLVGNAGFGNRMAIRDGAQYYGWISVGSGALATNNSLSISGVGTRYVSASYSERNPNDSFIATGGGGSFNKTLIDDGARVELLFYNGNVRRGMVAGVYSNSCGNEIVIRGKSFVTNMGWMCIGNTHGTWGGGSGNRVVIDDAIYFGQTIYVGGGNNQATNLLGISNGASTNNLLVVSGGAQVRSDTLLLGAATNSCANTLVMDGASTYLYGGSFYANSADNVVSLTNATLETGWINLGGYSWNNARTRLEFSGTNSRICTISQSIVITNGTTLAFNVGKEGYARVPFASLYDLRVDDTTGLEVNASQWARRTGGRLVLVQTGRTAQGSFTDWAARAVKDSEEFTVSAEGGLIVLTSPRKGGTLLKLF